MKKTALKLLVLSYLITVYSETSFAQCTPDNTLTEFGAYTSLGKNKIPNAWVNSAFEETMTLVVPQTFYGYTINQITLTGVDRLYTGLSYECIPKSCVFLGGTNGCIKITGTPTDVTQANQKTIDLNLNIVTSIVTFDTLLAAEFDLLDSSRLSVNEKNSYNFSISPNPANQFLNLSFNQQFQKDINLELWSVGGALMLKKNIKNSSLTATLPTDNIDNGLYVLRIEMNNEITNRLITIQH